MLHSRQGPSSREVSSDRLRSVLSAPTRVLRNGAPSSGFGIFNLGEEGRLRVQTFLQDSQNKSKELLIRGRAGDEKGTGFFFFHFNLWTTLITLLLCSCTCVAGFLSWWFFGFLSRRVWRCTVLTEASLLRVVLWRQFRAVGKTVA